MTSDDERDLRQRLGSALETITPHPAPVDVVLRKGRARRTRRHIAVAAGLAVAVGIGVAAPSLIQQIARPAPASPARKPTVTVDPVGPNSPRGLIGWGTVDGKRWRMIAQPPGAQGGGKNEQCFQPSGAVADLVCGPVPAPLRNGADPASFSSVGANGTQVQFGGVAPDVAYINVTLADGRLLVLHPALAYGQREVAFAAPQSLGIARVVAYSRQAELAYSVPFNSGSGAVISAWLRPGQRGLPRGTYKIGSGETVHVGPWGYCLTGVTQLCLGSEWRSLGNVANGRLGVGPGGADRAFGTATAAVDHVRVYLSGGITLTARAVDCGGPRFYAYVVPKGHKALRVAYYSASGHLLASQSAR
ncbi:MAG TPA: hypothetical protein VII22_18795 [Streptosporangiaceae bacterium]